MLFAVTTIYGCGSNDILGNYDPRNCVLKTNGSNSVTQLTFWVDSGGRSIVYTPKQTSNSLNLCQIISDSLKVKPSDVALVSASFDNSNDNTSAHGEFHLQGDTHSIVEIKQSIQ